MKILYLKGFKWLLSQNKRVRIDFLGYRWYEGLLSISNLFDIMVYMKFLMTSVIKLDCKRKNILVIV